MFESVATNSACRLFVNDLKSESQTLTQYKNTTLILDFNLKILLPVVALELVFQKNLLPVVITMVCVKMMIIVILMVYHLKRSPPVMDLKMTFLPLLTPH